MTRLNKAAMAVVFGLSAVALPAVPALAGAGHGMSGTGAPDTPVRARLANMDQGRGGGPGIMAPDRGSGGTYGMMPCQAYGAGPGQYRMGPGMMGPGMMGPGMMGPGMMGPGMMGPGMMGPGMMGPGMMGPGTMGPGYGRAVTPERDLSTDDVRHFLEHSLEMHGNERLKIGEVEEIDGDRILAEIVTQDGSLVERLAVDRHSGRMRRAQ